MGFAACVARATEVGSADFVLCAQLENFLHVPAEGDLFVPSLLIKQEVTAAHADMLHAQTVTRTS